jgi:hypothetical protein
MKAYGGVDVEIYIFLTSTLAGGEWSAFRLDCVTPRERAPGTHWIGGWVGPQSWSGQHDEVKILDSNSDPLLIQPVASRYTNCAIPANYSQIED